MTIGMSSRQALIGTSLVALVSIPAFLVGQKLRQGPDLSLLMLTALMAMVVVVASAIMRQMD